MKRLLLVVGLGGVLLLAAPLFIILAAVSGTSDSAGANTSTPNACAVGTTALAQAGGLSPAQQANAALIISGGRATPGIGDAGVKVALMASMQEDTLANSQVPNDHDSVGLFQMRPSQGWGSAAQVGDPAYSIPKFYSVLAAVPGWQQLDPGAAAQAVERSAFPGAYQNWSGLATALLAGASTLSPDCAKPDAPAGPVAGAAIAFATSKLGLPYQWGGTGPLYDCSGLVQAAYAAAGVALPRDTYGQVNVGTPVARDQLQPGDLVFPDAGHVSIYVGNGEVIEAPHTGAFVQRVKMWGWWEARRVA